MNYKVTFNDKKFLIPSKTSLFLSISEKPI